MKLINRSHMRHEMNRIQSKDNNIGSSRINKILIIYFNFNIVDYHIFINLLVNRIKVISSNIDNLF